MVTAEYRVETREERARRQNRERQQRWRDRRKGEKTAALPVPEPAPDLDPADVIAQWAERTLTVPTGRLSGQPFRLDGWQVEFLRDALAPGVREAALTCARKNGKSGKIAALCLCYLCGPLNTANWRAIVVSLTGALAAELRRQIGEIADASGLSELIQDYRSPTPGRIIGQNGAEITFLASDKATGNAVGADLTLTDESGLMPESQRPVWDAVYSCVSGRDGRNLHISVKGDGPMFSELLARRGQPGIVIHEYAADDDADLLDVDEWHKANPGLKSGIKSMDYMRDAAQRAADTPAAQSGFKVLDLNIAGDVGGNPIVTVADYANCVTAALPERAGDCWIALDVGGAAAFTGAAAYWPDTGRCEIFAGVGGIPDPAARGQADGVGDLYQRMADRGELWAYAGQRETPLTDFVADVAARLDGVNVAGLVCDEYRSARVLDALDAAGLKHWAARLQVRPVRWKTGNDDVVAFQGAVIGRRVAFPETLILPAAIRDSQLVADNNGNVRLDKSRLKGRIDVLTAAVLTVAAGERNRRDDSAASGFHDFV